ncbi:hypothetical protein BH23GEM4_BH23GEM4_06880 [soil metagenome]
MITAVDSSVLLDVFGGDPSFLVRSRAMLRSSAREGKLVACEVVWAETSAHFPSSAEASEMLDRVGLEFVPLLVDAAMLAGQRWGDYRRGGGPRTRVTSDFLIAAHALVQADRLVTRDRGFYRSYFQDLPVLDPAAS